MRNYFLLRLISLILIQSLLCGNAAFALERPSDRSLCRNLNPNLTLNNPAINSAFLYLNQSNEEQIHLDSYPDDNPQSENSPKVIFKIIKRIRNLSAALMIIFATPAAAYAVLGQVYPWEKGLGQMIVHISAHFSCYVLYAIFSSLMLRIAEKLGLNRKNPVYYAALLIPMLAFLVGHTLVSGALITIFSVTLIIPAVLVIVGVRFVEIMLGEYKNGIYEKVSIEEIQDSAIKAMAFKLSRLRKAEFFVLILIGVGYGILKTQNLGRYEYGDIDFLEKFANLYDVLVLIAFSRTIFQEFFKAGLEKIEFHINKVYGSSEEFLKDNYNKIDYNHLKSHKGRNRAFELISGSINPIVAISLDNILNINFYNRATPIAEKVMPWFSMPLSMIKRLPRWSKTRKAIFKRHAQKLRMQDLSPSKKVINNPAEFLNTLHMKKLKPFIAHQTSAVQTFFSSFPVIAIYNPLTDENSYLDSSI